MKNDSKDLSLFKEIILANVLGNRHLLDFPVNSDGKKKKKKKSVCNAEDLGSIPGLEDSLEKAMATHSSIPACGIPRTEEHGGLRYRGSQRVGHD